MNTNDYKKILKDADSKTKEHVSIALNLFCHLTGAPICNLSCMNKPHNQKYIDEIFKTVDELKAIVKE
jgi:hypothetical protein